MPTPHNTAEIEQIANTVFMCGDPLRAEYIAKNYLTDAKKVTEVRNMYGFTGKYDGKDVTVMGHGMGMPSIGIYTYELFNFYNVDSIIRIGSAGGLADDVNLRDLVIAMGACTDSNFAWQYELPGTYAPIADFSLLQRAVASAEKLGVPVRVGNILSTDVFYSPMSANEKWRAMGVLAVEMEAAALYMNAAKAGKKALCMCTISDHLFKPEKLSVEERQTGFDNMIRTALGMLS
ncbi:MAG TPA: purine-nucleoside phosphorylase [Bacillota bacterium]|nr:purine-nucleoside phosphorylase [Bacillota bacterium]HOK69540.1 purine-nucleoside phosphorylase [Bacillota bacterium]HPP85926.1 purine-nucleoside phosphorylase [Bacillota bacterium]